MAIFPIIQFWGKLYNKMDNTQFPGNFQNFAENVYSPKLFVSNQYLIFHHYYRVSVLFEKLQNSTGCFTMHLVNSSKEKSIMAVIDDAKMKLRCDRFSDSKI